MFGRINIEQELGRARTQREAKGPSDIVNTVHEWLDDEAGVEHRIIENLAAGRKGFHTLEAGKLAEDQIYYIDDIRQTCIRYRLRFLSTRFYKGDLPYEAIAKIKALQEEHGVELKHFRIMAPARMFKLEDCEEDPLLFLRIGEGKYYLIDRWGNDFSWRRRLLAFPMRSFASLFSVVFSIALLAAIFTPLDWIVNNYQGQSLEITNEIPYRGMLFVWAFVCLSSILTFLCLAFFKSFSTLVWNSSKFNQ